MISTNRRMIAVATLVCGFAVGMAGLLNYFKYCSTVEHIIKDRLIVTGRSVEGSIQGSLAIGMHLGDINTLPGTLERERATDNLILGIDVFDTDGQMLYSTDRLRAARHMPAGWLAAARKDGQSEWFAQDDGEAAAGISLTNNFGLRIGYVALRYSIERLHEPERRVAVQLAALSAAVFAVATLLAAGGLLLAMRRLARDVQALNTDLSGSTANGPNAAPARGPFGAVMQRYMATVREAETRIAHLHTELQRGSGT